MNEVQTPLSDPQREALKSQLLESRQAFHTEVAANNAADAAKLGEVAAHPIVTATGEVFTQKEREEDLRARQEQGPNYRH